MAYVLWALGVALLSGAWVLLRRRTVAPGHGLTVGTVGAIAALWMLPLLLVPPIGSRDVYSYVAHGELAAQGLDPGEVAPVGLGLTSPVLQSVDPVWRNVVSAYGPVNTGVAEAAVRVADHDVETVGHPVAPRRHRRAWRCSASGWWRWPGAPGGIRSTPWRWPWPGPSPSCSSSAGPTTRR